MSTMSSLRPTRTDPEDDGPDEGGSDTHGRRRTRLLVAAGVVVVLAAVAIWVVAFSSLLGVRTVQVHGTRSLTRGPGAGRVAPSPTARRWCAWTPQP